MRCILDSVNSPFRVRMIGLMNVTPALGTISLDLSRSLCYLKRYIEFQKDFWKKLDKTFGKNNEDHNRTLERTPAPQYFFIQKSRPLLSLMNLFKTKKKQNFLHNQFELKKT